MKIPELPWSDTPVFASIDCGEGWFPLIQRLHESIVAIDPDYRVIQVKEKFGGLRFYVEGASPEVHDLIAVAEEESFRTCEVCGQPGSSKGGTGFWIKTLCSDHRERS